MANHYREDIIDIELNSGSVHRSWLNHAIGLADSAANRFGVRLFRDGEAVAIGSATCQGYFRNSQGTNIALTSAGTVSGNVAYVTLPQACYDYEGPFTLAIKIVGGGITGTMRIIDGMVDNTNTSNTVAPTGTVPTYQEVLSVFEQAEAVVEASVRYDTTQSLTDAQKTTARENIEAASEDDVTDLKSAIYNNDNIIKSILKADVESGSWAYSSKTTNSKRLRTKELIPIKKGTIIRYTNDEQKVYFGVLETTSSNTYLQYSGWIAAGGDGAEYSIKYDGYLTFIVEDSVDITIDDYDVTVDIIDPPTHKDIDDLIKLCVRSGSTTLVITDAQAQSIFGANANNPAINTIIGIGTTGLSISNLPDGSNYKIGNLITIGFRIGNLNGKNQLYIEYETNRVYVRSYVTNVWTSWAALASKAEADQYALSLRPYSNTLIINDTQAAQVFESDADKAAVNSVIAVGARELNISNLPDGEDYQVGILLTFAVRTGNLNGKTQLYISYYGDLFSRSYVSNAWTSWTEYAKKSEITSVLAILATKTSLITSTMVTTNELAESMFSSDLDNLEPNKIYCIGATGLTIYHTPYDDFIGNVVSLSFRETSNVSGRMQIAISDSNRLLTRIHFSGSWGTWKEYADKDDIEDIEDALVDKTSLITKTMILTEEQADTFFSKDINNLAPNKIYCIGIIISSILNTPYSSFIGNIVSLSFRETSNPSGRMQIAISDTNHLFTRIHFGGSWTSWKEYANENEVVKKETIYHVGSTRTYTSLVALLKVIQTKTEPSIIYMDEGEYDIFAEYKSNNIPSPPSNVQPYDYFDYNVFLPKNCRLVGIGNVVLNWNPSTSEITEAESKTWSPLNLWYGGNTVENITIKCKNGRYCVHDDSHNAYKGFTNKYKNVQFIYTQSDPGYGFDNVVGFGFEDKCIYEFDDCLFQFIGSGNKGVFYGHEGSTGGGSIIVKNCVILGGTSENNMAIKLQTLYNPSGTNRIRTLFNGCHVEGGIRFLNGNTDGQQRYDVTLLHSGNPSQSMEYPNRTNPYTIKVYQ